MAFMKYSDPNHTREEIIANNRREGAKNAAKTQARLKTIRAYFAKFGFIGDDGFSIGDKELTAMVRSLETGKDHLAKRRAA